jgi:lipopolysaccharide export system ATP-binding protein
MIVGLVKPNSGTVLIDGQDITSWPMNLRAKEGIGYLPQENSIFRNLTIEDGISQIRYLNDD